MTCRVVHDMLLSGGRPRCAVVGDHHRVTRTGTSSLSNASHASMQFRHAWRGGSRRGARLQAQTGRSRADEDEDEDSNKHALSCVWVDGSNLAEIPLDRLEALYTQARDSHSDGAPVVQDAMYERVEVMLRQRGSKLPLKYPRCSLTRFEAFSDAEEDASLLRGMWGLWGALLVLGAALGTRGLYLGGSSLLGMVAGLGGVAQADTGGDLVQAAVCLVFAPSLCSVSANVLRKLSAGFYIPLKGACPSCLEEVSTIMENGTREVPLPADALKDGGTSQPVPVRASQRSECHMCEQPLSFHAAVHCGPSLLRSGGWAYGRIYAKRRAAEMEPSPRA